MLMPCEIVTKEFIPTLRLLIIKDLYSNYKMTQVGIATKLNLTQAAISKYLSGDYSNDLRTLEKNEKMQHIAKKIASHIADKNSDKIKVVNSICKSCEEFFAEEWDCKISG